ncbi:MAG TPA: NUDIX domain-containing protein [Chromatiales bacterium]|nr:NUDIX domain-containing protein [Chromatiales bacterium]
MKYCTACAAPLERRVPEGDDRVRHVCPACGTIHYQNPKIVTGTIPIHEDRVLLCRRAIEPRRGLWTAPAGFMENAETVQEGALRETREEANARVRIDALHAVYNLPHISQVYLLFRATLLDLDFSPGRESLEVRLFDEREIPWDALAFPVVIEALKAYFEDLRRGHFRLHMGDIERLPGPGRRYRIVHTVP